ncbi:MAG: ATP-binding cassette domain-containing protein [Marinifilaceae bacterium]
MMHIEDLSFAYTRHNELFFGLNLDIKSGHIYGLLGKNGAGKSTLLKLMCGLLFPQQGKVTMNGVPTMDRRPDIMREIYFVPEELYLPPLTLKGYVDCFSPFYPRFDHELFNRIITEFAVEGNKRLDRFSYGQKKKFFIAFALSTRVSLLVMDEPTNGLDIPSKSVFRRVVASSLDENSSIIISTHQVRDLEQLIDSVVVVDSGKVLFNQSLNAIQDALLLKTVNRGTPITEPLLYVEPVPGGEAVIVENVNNEESYVDFELLFNGVLASYKEINRVINRVNNSTQL